MRLVRLGGGRASSCGPRDQARTEWQVGSGESAPSPRIRSLALYSQSNRERTPHTSSPTAMRGWAS